MNKVSHAKRDESIQSPHPSPISSADAQLRLSCALAESALVLYAALQVLIARRADARPQHSTPAMLRPASSGFGLEAGLHVQRSRADFVLRHTDIVGEILLHAETLVEFFAARAAISCTLLQARALENQFSRRGAANRCL